MIKKLLSSQLRINMASGMATTVVNIAILAITYPLYLHFLGYEKYGVWLILATVLSFAQLGNLGINQAVMKLVAEEYGRKNIEGIQCYITTALVMLCTSGTIILAIVLMFKLQIIALFKLNTENAKLAVWLLPYIGILSIYIFIVNVFNAVLSGLDRMDLANYIQTVSKVVAVAVATVLLCFGWGIESMIISSAVSYLFIQAVSIICVRKMISIRILHLSNLNAQYGQRLLSFGGAVVGGSLISMFLNPFNKLILSRYVGVSAVPLYEIAFNGSMQIRALFEAGLRAMMPEISKISANTTRYAKDRISQINRRVMKLVLLFGIPVYAGLFILITPLLKVWLRGKFTESLPLIFRIMLIGVFLNLLCVPAYYTLMGMGKVRYCFISYVIQGVVNALIVGGIIFFNGTASLFTTTLAVVLAMGITSFYIIWQNRRAMRMFQPDAVRSCSDVIMMPKCPVNTET